jgi:pyruvate/2-oxoglutarate dehydrogenase complex dihydrolipoamide dehydrogenase (E3) component
MSDYDIVVLGGGAAGFVASKFANGLGKKVALIEKSRLGGECTLYGCVPSKAFIKSANIAHQIKHLKKYGLRSHAEIGLDTAGVMDHVRSVVQKVYDSHPPEVFQKIGIDVMFGDPRFIDNHTIELNNKIITSKYFVIATGSSSFIPSIEGINNAPYLTNESFWEMKRLPASMIVLGGGPIGIELAAAMNRLGVKVSVIEMSETILAREDRELAAILSDSLKAEGVNILNGAKALKLSGIKGDITLTIEDADKQTREIKAEAALVAVGRKANVGGLDLEKAGVEYTLKGIKTNNRLRTTAPNIYACGDVVGPYQFSHMAEYQARIAVQNALLPLKKEIDYRNVAWCTFTDPELARAGLTEDEARKEYGDKINVYKCEYKNIDRGKMDVSDIGMSKFITGPDGRLLGIHMLGSSAGEIIHEAHLAKALGVPFHKLDSLIHIYPTFSDIVKQPAKLARIERLQRNPFLKILKSILGKK